MNTVAKRFPFLRDEKVHYLSDVLKECRKPENKQKVFTSVEENEDLIKNNYDIMQLAAPMLSIQARQGIDETFQQYKPHYNQTEVRKKMIKDGVLTVNTSDLEQRFNHIITSFSQ